ncbi:hypothetical protein P154DRAFT_547693 [Amniculicola lignicola CBS 123094]|uniref:Transcriptional activator of proteases prtT n=1 Tax=Amniculicola lignicola CBS 123094 TaxID=1392246 RepID=A0A6A5W4M9_9PLEO|nr:hypothetical protein P154DRAFT_547693 [Amniculicola lignicola CBS 123094]
MLPDRGRASKTCAACRKQKTRCNESPAGRALSSLERTVNALVRRLDGMEPVNNSLRSDQPSSLVESIRAARYHAETASAEQVPAPLFVLRDVTRETGFRPADRTATNTPSRGLSDDTISKGIASEQETITLLALFQEHYGRWVSFNPLTQPALLLEDLRAFPLLLSACCLIAVRHTTQDLAARLAPKLFKEAKTLLSIAMLHVPLSIGSWLLSGSAIQQTTAMLDPEDVDCCCVILGSDHATNFESRMVAEVYLYWIIYESCGVSVDLPKAQAALHTWKEEWGFLLEQFRAQFLQMGFYFPQLLVYDQSLKSRSAAVRESLLLEMVRLSTSIINLAMDTGDDRTRHLSDHIYHMISFAAVTLCRLLHTYEEQLPLSHDLHGLDRLILSLASWLHAIGLPAHIAFTMGNVVAGFHKKLRPNSGPSPSASYAEVDPAIQDDFAWLFPELFGTASFDMMNGTMLPEYQPI